MPSRRAQQYQVGGSVVGLTARSLSVPTLYDTKGTTSRRQYHSRAHTAMGSLAEQVVYNSSSRDQLRYISNGIHHTLLEEEEEEREVSNLHLIKHRSRSSMSTYSGEDPEWQLIPPSSPGARSSSTHSGQSSPSEVGDSGVSSEHDTPPLVSKHPARSRPLRHHTSSDSDSESNVSSDSLPESYSRKNSNNHNTNNNNISPWAALRTSGSRRSSSRFSLRPAGSKVTLPEALLNEIREKWAELQQRRAQQGRSGDLILGRTASQTQWSPSRHTQRRSCPASPSLSRSSSNFPSSLSLFEEDLDTASCASPVFFESLRHPTLQMAPVHMEDTRSLFECRDEDAGQGFAGLRDIFSPQQESTIKSYKGTVRGVKNRVRAGIATFTSDQRILKHFMDRERGKVVVYITTLGIVRDTYERCLKIRKILWTLLVRFEERDVFMARDTQLQLIDRLHSRGVSVPHVFLEGQYLGDAEIIERMNECGELRRLLQPYRKSATSSFCNVCGGFRLLPCSVCNGSKKSVHRNDFTLEFVALKCSSCDESGLIKCNDCAEYKEETNDQEI